MQELHFASTNPAKLAQFQFVADYYTYQVKILSIYKQFPQVKAYDEDFPTQEQIIENGAREIYRQVEQPIIVEDTILEVTALGNKPGLTASEYLKRHGREGLVEELTGKTDRAAIMTSMVGYYDGKLLVMFKNRVYGAIGQKDVFKLGEPDWIGPTDFPLAGGFNAIFVEKQTGRTLADMTAEEGLTFGYREPNFRALLKYIHAQ